MTADLRSIVRDAGAVPLSWAGATTTMNYLNWGDAMSPVMVALLTGRAIVRVPSRSQRPRLAAVGTIAHGIAGGDAWIWGSGCSTHLKPTRPGEQLVRYSRPANTRFHVAATRGPLSADLLGAGDDPSVAYGDPVWLLPRFYRPPVRKTHEIGVILHLSELADRAYEAHPLGNRACYAGLADDGPVKLINTCTPISARALADWIDGVRACKRIVSTSLHGMVVAEAYGIPCLPLAGGKPGLRTVSLVDKPALDSRFVDLFRGLGLAEVPIYGRDLRRPIDWDDLAAAIDAAWREKTLDEDRLVTALPIDAAPISAPEGGDVFDHPAIAGLAFQHDVAALRAEDAARYPAAVEAAPRPTRSSWLERLGFGKRPPRS